MRAVIGVLAVAWLLLTSAAPAAALPPGFQDSVVFGGLTQPTDIAFAPDGRVFVAEKSGLIKVFDNLSDPTPTVYADLRTNVYNFWDRGLLGIALDPNFSARPYIYALYTYDAAIGGTAPLWGTAGATSDPCPSPPGATSDGCVVSARLSRLVPPSTQSSGYRQTILNDNPFLYWRLDEASGSFLDQTANHNDASAVGSGVARAQSSLLPGDADASVKFTDGTSSVESASVRGLPSTQISVEAWIKTNTNADWIDYVRHAWGGTPGQGWDLFSSASGNLWWGLYQGGGSQLLLTAPDLLQPGTVYYVAGTYDGSTLRLYVNGQLVASKTVGPLTLNATNTTVGSGYTNTSAGVSVDELAAYPTALSASQILAHFNAGTQAPAPPGSGQPQEQVLINDWCQQYPSHSIGTVKFGADGALYVGGGDGASFTFLDYGQKGSPLNPCGDPPVPVGGVQTLPSAEGGSFRSQDLRTSGDPVTLDGTIIRVDPDTGAALPGNPLAASSDPNARRLIAYGLRNPFRFTFMPGTNEIWVGDVGSGNWEEIDRITSPTDSVVENFGWPCYEGALRQSGYEALNDNICSNLYAAGSGAVASPYYAYQHSDQVVAGESCPTGSSSISGIVFAPDSGPYPAPYAGSLFFADYSRDCIWVMHKGTNGLPDKTSLETFEAPAAAPVDLEIGPGGDLFYVDLDGGTIRRVSYAASNHAPTAAAQATPTSGTAPLTVAFDGSNSTDPDPGDTLNYAWDLDGDGAYDDSTAQKPSYTYTASGVFTVRLKVTDGQGLSDTSDPLTITVGSPPSVTIATPSASTTWKVGDVISFSGSATDDPDGPLPASALTWDLILHHCPSTCHLHFLQTFAGTASGSFTAPDHEYPSYLELRLTATDSSGLTDSKSVLLYPQTVDLTFNSSPSGLQLTVNAAVFTTPFTRTVIKGSTNTISAPTPQTLNGVIWDFSSWSDGGSRSHDIVANASAPFTAVYASPPKNASVPVISGQPREGRTLSVTNGTWTGATPITFAYQWQRCNSIGGSCLDLIGATSTSYFLTSADAGFTIRARVTASNAFGSSSAISAPTAVVKRRSGPGLAAGSFSRELFDALTYKRRALGGQG
jgi:glucose/arabinose dehydrogenase/PKD repeat protein